MSAKYSVIYNRKGKLNKQGKALIQIRVHFNQHTSKYISTDIYISPYQWHEKKKTINDSHPAQYTLNKRIKMRIAELEEFENELVKYDTPFNKEILNKYINGQYKKEALTFNAFFEEEMDKLVSYQPSTRETWLQTLNKLNKFNHKISFRNINYELVSSFDNHLAITGAKSINARWKHHKNFKKFLNIAIANNYFDLADYPYESNAPGGKIGKFKVPREEGEKIPLDFEEIQRLNEMKYPEHPHLQRTLDVYLFMCYTGLRISDATSLELFGYIHHTVEGYSLDLKRMKKLRRQVYLELYTLFDGKPDLIIRKYLKKTFGTDKPNVLTQKLDRSIFGNIDKDRFNRYLKLIAHDAKINKNLSAHTARHTFGTQMAVLTNGNINMVMDLMGISKYETAKVYIKLADRIVNKQLKKVNWNEYNEIDKTQESNAPSLPSVTSNSHSQVEQLASYIRDHVIPDIKGINGHKIPFALNTGSLKSYSDKLPLSSEYLATLKENPFEISGIVYGMEHAEYIDTIESRINNHKWFRLSYLKVKIMLMPFDDGLHKKVFI